MTVSRREFLKRAGLAGVVVGINPLEACAALNGSPVNGPPSPEDQARLRDWSNRLNSTYVERANSALIGQAAARVGVFAIGTPYVPYTLEQYLKAGGNPEETEPLTLSLTRFDCVTLVESSLGVARAARRATNPTWQQFAREVEKMRYRGGVRRGFASRLHYFSEWISDGEARGLVKDLGQSLGGVNDARPLRFMTEHRASYPGLKNDSVFAAIRAMQGSLDSRPRFFIPTDHIPVVQDQIRTGDVLAFATSIPGLDVTHAAFAYRGQDDVLRVLHAPLSGGSVEISTRTLPDYVAAIKRSTGILVARPLA